MSELGPPTTYNEATIIWRMQRADGRQAAAVIDPLESGTRVIWFMNGRPLGARYFDDWTGAIEWADRLQAQYWSVGWRLPDDTARHPPTRSES